ncbi:MAG: hypothetical protein WBR56_12555, partial [Sedimenticolaceae bacterium]
MATRGLRCYSLPPSEIIALSRTALPPMPAPGNRDRVYWIKPSPRISPIAYCGVRYAMRLCRILGDPGAEPERQQDQ